MKTTTYLMALILIVFSSCGPDYETVWVEKTESYTITMSDGYANDVYFSLKNGEVKSENRTNWDIAFAVDAMSSAILINEAASVELKVQTTDDSWTWLSPIDTAGLYMKEKLFNPDTTWEDGAFGANASGHPNYGWGIYNMETHNLSGAALYIIKTRSGNYKQIFIESKTSAEQKYTFKYADINGENEKVVDLVLAGKDKNFVYYSIDDNLEIDREPAKETWDLVLTKWVDNMMHYPVTGIFQNSGVMALQYDEVTAVPTEFPADGFLEDISVIGYDWKSINMQTFTYDVDENKVFFVKDMNEEVHKLVLKSFEIGTGATVIEVTSMVQEEREI